MYSPRMKPHKCHRFNSGNDEIGPFFEESFDYLDPRDPDIGAYGQGQALRLYHSAAWIMEMCNKPGSPFKVMRTEDYNAQVADYENKLADLEEKIERLEAEQETLLAGAPSPIDEEALTNNIIAHLDGRYARKAGRKPSGTAA